MDEKLDVKICSDFPSLYRDRHGNMQDTALCWGLAVGNGWYDLIYTLSEVLTNIIENAKSHAIYEYKKEHNLDYSATLSSEIVKSLKIDEKAVICNQVKSKFAILCWYFSTEGLTEEEYAKVSGAVHMAEAMSRFICEGCGNKGKTTGKHWITTLCSGCEIKQKMGKI